MVLATFILTAFVWLKNVIIIGTPRINDKPLIIKLLPSFILNISSLVKIQIALSSTLIFLFYLFNELMNKLDFFIIRIANVPNKAPTLNEIECDITVVISIK